MEWCKRVQTNREASPPLSLSKAIILKELELIRKLIVRGA